MFTSIEKVAESTLKSLNLLNCARSELDCREAKLVKGFGESEYAECLNDFRYSAAPNFNFDKSLKS